MGYKRISKAFSKSVVETMEVFYLMFGVFIPISLIFLIFMENGNNFRTYFVGYFIILFVYLHILNFKERKK